MTTDPAELPRRPAWASDRLVDETLIEYSHAIGSVGTCGDDVAFDVVVIQQDELDLDGDPPKVIRHEPEIRLSHVRISPEQARDLAMVLTRGADFVKALAGSDQPPRPRQSPGD
jgi:hypothetical protein